MRQLKEYFTLVSLIFVGLLTLITSDNAIKSPREVKPTGRLEEKRLHMSEYDVDVRAALLVTLAGDHKLAEYFEWSCRTFGNSEGAFDMLVFHESNRRLESLKCAPNVKFIDLGVKGLSKRLVELIFGHSKYEVAVKDRLSQMIDGILVRSPRYLVEIKPLLGTLFSQELTSYSHWSYTDPDIIWGNLSNWVEMDDLQKYDYLSFTKNQDAGRLFLRGQLCFHRNVDHVNSLWRELRYFDPNSYAERIGNAFHMLESKHSTDEVFAKNFHSAEGWYSQLVFAQNATTVKLVGRGFDDFYRAPVVLHRGALGRCSTKLHQNVTDCIHSLAHTSSSSSSSQRAPASIHTLPEIHAIPATAYHDSQECKMFWLPTDTRYCIAKPVYGRRSQQHFQQPQQANTPPRVRLQRVGEAMYGNGSWSINDETVARRQIAESAAFFHFRHWDDVISSSISTVWSKDHAESSIRDTVKCMVLYLRGDGALAFEACSEVIQKEKRAGSKTLLLEAAPIINGRGGDSARRSNRNRQKNRQSSRHRNSDNESSAGTDLERASKDELSQFLIHERRQQERGPKRMRKNRDHGDDAAGKPIAAAKNEQDSKSSSKEGTGGGWTSLLTRVFGGTVGAHTDTDSTSNSDNRLRGTVESDSRGSSRGSRSRQQVDEPGSGSGSVAASHGAHPNTGDKVIDPFDTETLEESDQRKKRIVAEKLHKRHRKNKNKDKNK